MTGCGSKLQFVWSGTYDCSNLPRTQDRTSRTRLLRTGGLVPLKFGFWQFVWGVKASEHGSSPAPPPLLRCAVLQLGGRWVERPPQSFEPTSEWTHQMNPAADEPDPSRQNKSWNIKSNIITIIFDTPSKRKLERERSEALRWISYCI